MVEEQLARIHHYFPDLTDEQTKQIEQLYPLYEEWNQKINVISRKDIENLYLHHVLHSMSILHYVQFEKQSSVIDIGTGGGFPGVPLAILFPDVQFDLLDSRKKKLTVIDEVSNALGLKNIRTIHERAELHTEKYNFITCRALADFEILKKYMRHLLKEEHSQGLPNGLLALKGGDVKMELKKAGIHHAEVIPLSDYFEEEFFSTKHLIYIQI